MKIPSSDDLIREGSDVGAYPQRLIQTSTHQLSHTDAQAHVYCTQTSEFFLEPLSHINTLTLH